MGIHYMVKQISLDTWQIKQLVVLLEKGSKIVAKTDRPIVLYRVVLEEEDDSYEEIVCTLTKDYIIEQTVTSGGVIPPSFGQQSIFTIKEYPQVLLQKSKERFLDIVDLLEEQLK